MAAPTTASSTLTSLAAAYKELFPQIRLEQLALIDRDLLRWLPKKDDLVGDGIHIPVRYGTPQGYGSRFTGAQGVITAGKVKRFFIQRNRYYGFVTLDDESVRAARDRTGAFYDVKEAEIEDITQAVSEQLEIHLWRNGDGNRGQIASITSAVPSVITLTNAEDVANFRVDQTIGANTASDGSGTDRTGEEKITVIDYDAGTITMTTNVVADHSWAANDFLFNVAGNNTVGEGDDVVTGLEGWIPLTAEVAGTFFGMDRTDDPVRLQGFRQETFLGTVEETLKKLNSRMRRLGGSGDAIWLSHNNWHRLEQELGARAVREDGSPATFGLPSLKYASPKGMMRVFAGAFAPEDRGYILKRSDWTLHHLDGLPHMVMTDGLRMLRGAEYDGVEVRVRFWCELATPLPKNQGVFKVE